jgi:hypothetical protein
MSRKLMLSAATALMLLAPAYAGERAEWGSVGHEMCHDEATTAVTDFPCPKNLPVRTFTCRPASEAEANGIGHTRPSRVHPFPLRADPSNARLTVANAVISTTDVLMDTSNDWQTLDVDTPWNGNSQIRDTQFDLSKGTDGVWRFFDHLELYICVQR